MKNNIMFIIDPRVGYFKATAMVRHVVREKKI